MSDPLSMVGVVLADKFRIERLLGEGGFGVVYAGTHLLLNEPIAVKFMKLEGGDADRAAAEFLREARILFSLAHPAIVRMYDVGTVARGAIHLPWVVLELLSGPTLDQETSNRRHASQRMSIADLQQIFEPIVEGLAFAHSRDIIHRDIKPSNILISRPRNSAHGFEPKLLDFGTARSQSSTFQTSAGMTGFTPLYAAPEQWDPSIARPTPATDVYSLGLTMLECATLQKAFIDADNIATLMRSVATGTGRQGLSVTRPDLPIRLHAVLERATAVDPHARFQHAGELLVALKEAFSRSIVTSATSGATANISPHAMTSSVAAHSMTSQLQHSPAPLPMQPMPRVPPAVVHVQTTSPYVLSQQAPAPANAPMRGGVVAVLAFLSLLLVIAVAIGVLLYIRVSQSDDAREAAIASREQQTLQNKGDHAKVPTLRGGPSLAISPALVTPDDDFDMPNALDVVHAHQSEIESCGVKSAKFSGELGVAIEVSTKDGHVIGSTCHTNWPHHDSKNPAIDPSAIDFCGCTQRAIANWKFKPAKAEPMAMGFDDSQTLQVKYTAP